MSIHDTLEKINPVRNREGSQRPSVSNGVKSFIESEKGKDILTVIIVILVGLSSFELGRLSQNSNSGDINIEYPTKDESQAGSVILSKNSTPIQNSADKIFFASNRGTKYYSLGCSAGKDIKQENRVYFATGEEAQKAGYELSNSCR